MGCFVSHVSQFMEDLKLGVVDETRLQKRMPQSTRIELRTGWGMTAEFETLDRDIR